MSARGFGSLLMAASVAGAALGCYLVSLNVASERAELEAVEAQIVGAQREIRVLQTEIGTRGRLAQLERWNASFIRLSAPSADQILEGSFQLASMVKPPARHSIETPMVLASAPAPERSPGAGATSDDDRPAASAAPAARTAAPGRPDQMMQVASYSVPQRGERISPKPTAEQGAAKPAAAKDKAALTRDKVPPTKDKSVAAKPRLAAADPLAPLPSAKTTKAPAAKDSDTPR